MKASSWIVLGVGVVAVIGIAGAVLLTGGGDEDSTADATVAGETNPVGSAAPESASSVVMPELSLAAQIGQVAFTDNCARCHGANGGGTDQGPPLIHIIYEPNHHSDIAFVLAARNGSRAHHWQFGDMPPQPQVSETEITAIIQFVREVQRANGIF
jgi:mono/diheme cytochrome c family protein